MDIKREKIEITKRFKEIAETMEQKEKESIHEHLSDLHNSYYRRRKTE